MQLDTLGGTPAEAKNLQSSNKKKREKKRQIKISHSLKTIDMYWRLLLGTCVTNAKCNGSCIQLMGQQRNGILGE